ncbi:MULTISPECIES: hypothetical protein [Psychrobacter]|uniref:hypothetical protein n=1 Tax=Psychrobacter TaxID=497 RepID=UPI00146F18DB|nr:MULTISPECIES: hypothetical protein [Psychrobacter]
MLHTRRKHQEDHLITIVHSTRLKPIKRQLSIRTLEAERPIDQAYLAELAGSDEYVSIAFCYRNYNDVNMPRLSINESCAVISLERAKEMLRTENMSECALDSVRIILFSAVSQTFGGFLTDGETDNRYVLSKGVDYAHLSKC